MSERSLPHIFGHTNTHIHTHIFLHTGTNAYKHFLTREQTPQTHAQKCTNANERVRTHIQTNKNTYTNTRTHTHARIPGLRRAQPNSSVPLLAHPQGGKLSRERPGDVSCCWHTPCRGALAAQASRPACSVRACMCVVVGV